MLCADDAHLVTLTGPAGVGKTRLACEAATVAATHLDAVHYVDLTPVTSPDMLLSAIAASLGIPDSTTRMPLACLTDAFHGINALVVLDNFEHLIAAAPSIAALLTNCPTLRLLITSRVMLRLRWERLVQVAPLPVPPDNETLAPDALGRIPSVALFLERVQSVNPSFSITPANARAVAEICTRLEGIPLSIELAASHMRRLSPQGLLGRLEHPLDVLRNGPRDLPLRQQSLRTAVGASYALLAEREQQVARLLSVFRGGGSFAAVRAIVCDAGDLQVGDIHESLEILAEHSLIHIHEPEPGRLRFTILDATRHCLMEHLRASSDADATMDRFVAWYAGQVRDALNETGRPRNGKVLRRLRRDDENLQAVLQWSLEQHRPDVGLELAARLWRYWVLTDRVATGRYWLTELLHEGDVVLSAGLRCRGLAAAGYLAARSGEYEQAGELLERARTMRDGSFGDIEEAELLAELGSVRVLQGEWTEASMLLNASLALLEGADAPLTRARALAGSARLALEQDDIDIARSLLGECYALVAGISGEGMVDVLCQHADLSLLTGDAVGAQERYEEALSRARDERFRGAEARALIGLADVAVAQFRPEDARRGYREALLLLEGNTGWDHLMLILEGVAALAANTNRTEHLDWLVGQTAQLRQRAGGAPSTARGAWVERRLSGVRQTGERVLPSAARPLKVSPVFEEVVRQLMLVLDHLPPTFSSRHLDIGQRGGTAVLSSREREVARYISDGFTNRQIAANLRIAERTVDSHVGNILRKLELSSRTQIAAWEIRQALLRSPEPGFGGNSDPACTPS
jgi:predicted ATPase/DNA-binding CsgD family transcriptional regulator